MTGYFAFDPGKLGGWAFIIPGDGAYVEKIEVGMMPLIGKGKGADYDLPRIKRLLVSANERCERLVVAIEDVHAVQKSGASTAFQFGRGLGILEGIVAGMGIPYVKVYSKTWQKTCFEGVPSVMRKNDKTVSGVSSDTKAMSKIAVARLYPNVDTTKSARAENPHDGICDALLIAHHAKVTGL